MSWAGRSAGEIAEAVRKGVVSAAAIVEEHLGLIAERDQKIGAFRVVRQQAIDEARAVQERHDLATLPLAGVPVAVKDNLAVAGEATRNGSAATSKDPATEDHPAVARLRAAGAVVVGITNVPELCLVGFSDSVYGTARNPWDLTRTAGGSSGGSAAAVSAGMVPIALGNDGMGSLRIPGACCGVLTIKPGPGVIPPPAHDWHGLSENGPLANTASDLALALAVLSADPSLERAWETGRRVDPPPPMLRSVWDDADVVEPVTHRTSPEPFDLRIAYAPQPLPAGLTMDSEFRAAVTAAAERLRVAGHTIVEHGRLPAWLGPSTIATWLACAADDAAELDRKHLERRTRALARGGRVLRRLGMSGVKGRERWQSYGADQWFGDADVLITPTLAALPPKADRWGSRGFLRNSLINVRYAPATGPWNMCGWPALSLPFATHTSGLPISIQLIAPPGSEPQLLRLAAQLEPYRPPYHPPGF